MLSNYASIDQDKRDEDKEITAIKAAIPKGRDALDCAILFLIKEMPNEEETISKNILNKLNNTSASSSFEIDVRTLNLRINYLCNDNLIKKISLPPVGHGSGNRFKLAISHVETVDSLLENIENKANFLGRLAKIYNAEKGKNFRATSTKPSKRKFSLINPNLPSTLISNKTFYGDQAKPVSKPGEHPTSFNPREAETGGNQNLFFQNKKTKRKEEAAINTLRDIISMK